MKDNNNLLLIAVALAVGYAILKHAAPSPEPYHQSENNNSGPTGLRLAPQLEDTLPRTYPIDPEI